MFSPGWSEMLILGVIALLLFGKRLPEVARSLGQGFVEFKKGMRGFETEMHSTVYNDPVPKKANRPPRIEQDLMPTGEKFDVSAVEDASADSAAAADSGDDDGTSAQKYS